MRPSSAFWATAGFWISDTSKLMLLLSTDDGVSACVGSRKRVSRVRHTVCERDYLPSAKRRPPSSTSCHTACPQRQLFAQQTCQQTIHEATRCGTGSSLRDRCSARLSAIAQNDIQRFQQVGCSRIT